MSTTNILGLKLYDDASTETGEAFCKAQNFNGAGTEQSPKSNAQIIDDWAGETSETINTLKGVVETFAITSWTADANISPYAYKATVTATATIGANTIVELLNNNAILFATYGFAIGDITNQVVTIYSIGEPESTISISIRIGGVLSNSSGGGSDINLYMHHIVFQRGNYEISFNLINTTSTAYNSSSVTAIKEQLTENGVVASGYYSNNYLGVCKISYEGNQLKVRTIDYVNKTSTDQSASDPTYVLDNVTQIV